jgi:hypothetical protein
VANPRQTAHARRAVLGVILAGVAVLGGLITAPRVWAHGEGETEEGYLLVQQALGHLAHDTSMAGVDLAMEKVDDALKTEDQEGVDVAELQRAHAALEAHQVGQGRALLEDSIREALAQLKPATGEDTGTRLVPAALPGRGTLAAGDAVLLVASVLVLLVGIGLAWRYRPADTLGDLRGRLNPPKAPEEASRAKRSEDGS